MQRKQLPKKSTPQIRSYEAAVRAGKHSRHVVKTDNGWAVKQPGAKRASGVFATQSQAVDAAKRTVSRSRSGEIFVHGRDGKIRERL